MIIRKLQTEVTYIFDFFFFIISYPYQLLNIHTAKHFSAKINQDMVVKV